MVVNLTAYGPQYNVTEHSWPVGVTPTGPPCRRCKGAGEVYVDDRPEHTKYPNPHWEPGEPTVLRCEDCNGTGVRRPLIQGVPS